MNKEILEQLELFKKYGVKNKYTILLPHKRFSHLSYPKGKITNANPPSKVSIPAITNSLTSSVRRSWMQKGFSLKKTIFCL